MAKASFQKRPQNDSEREKLSLTTTLLISLSYHQEMRSLPIFLIFFLASSAFGENHPCDAETDLASCLKDYEACAQSIYGKDQSCFPLPALDSEISAASKMPPLPGLRRQSDTNASNCSRSQSNCNAACSKMSSYIFFSRDSAVAKGSYGKDFCNSPEVKPINDEQKRQICKKAVQIKKESCDKVKADLNEIDARFKAAENTAKSQTCEAMGKVAEIKDELKSIQSHVNGKTKGLALACDFDIKKCPEACEGSAGSSCGSEPADNIRSAEQLSKQAKSYAEGLEAQIKQIAGTTGGQSKCDGSSYGDPSSPHFAAADAPVTARALAAAPAPAPPAALSAAIAPPGGGPALAGDPPADVRPPNAIPAGAVVRNPELPSQRPEGHLPANGTVPDPKAAPPAKTAGPSAGPSGPGSGTPDGEQKKNPTGGGPPGLPTFPSPAQSADAPKPELRAPELPACLNKTPGSEGCPCAPGDTSCVPTPPATARNTGGSEAEGNPGPTSLAEKITAGLDNLKDKLKGMLLGPPKNLKSSALADAGGGSGKIVLATGAGGIDPKTGKPRVSVSAADAGRNKVNEGFSGKTGSAGGGASRGSIQNKGKYRSGSKVANGAANMEDPQLPKGFDYLRFLPKNLKRKIKGAQGHPEIAGRFENIFEVMNRGYRREGHSLHIGGRITTALKW